jgi:hypothetical protein
MNPQPASPGGAAVGHLLEMPELERQVILYLRLWCDGQRGRQEVWQDLAARQGAAEARRTLGAFEELVGLAVAHARRPLVHHRIECPCAGVDECALARMVALSAEGAREDAALIATLLIRPDMALVLAAIAAEFGLLLRRAPVAATPSHAVPARTH